MRRQREDLIGDVDRIPEMREQIIITAFIKSSSYKSDAVK